MTTGFFLSLVLVVLAQAKILVRAGVENPEEYVNILGGTASMHKMSHGGTLPLIARPWGFGSYAPLTNDNGDGWWFQPDDTQFFGLRATHQPSPWIGDYGNFLLKAYFPTALGPVPSEGDKWVGYSPSKSTYSPYYFKITELAFSTDEETTTLEFTPTNHGGIMRVEFPTYVPHVDKDVHDIDNFIQTRRIAIVLPGSSGSGFSEVIASPLDGTTMISGYSTQNSGGVGDSNAAFAHYFVAAIYGGPQGDQTTSFDANSTSTSSGTTYADFSPEEVLHKTMTVRIATSFISTEQALHNLKSEVHTDVTFEDVMASAKEEWKNTLSRVTLEDIGDGYDANEEEDLYTVFYSTMYRASLFPRQISETTAEGKVVHWTPFATSEENRVREGPYSTDSGFWDAWNTVYPLLSLANRPQLSTTLQGWLNQYQEGQWIAQWASPGFRASMVGTMGDVSLAAAIVNEIPDFDVEVAYEAIRKDAFEVPPPGINEGRDCLEIYESYGFVPKDMGCGDVVARTLNYMQADWAISRAAAKLGKVEDELVLFARSANYSKIFDGDTGFFRPKMPSDKFHEPFDQFAWGDDYTEGGPWQYRFYVPYDVEGLSALYAANGMDMCGMLEKTQTQKTSAFHFGGYGQEIHEQTELPDGCWGQYAHNNQPAHHMLYMYMQNGYTSTDCAARGQYWLRKATAELYKPTSAMFVGDEDNGEMSAWYILSTMGLYQLSPGSEDFVLGSPRFAKITVDISDIATGATGSAVGNEEPKTLTIIANNQSPDNVFVQAVYFDGVLVDTSSNTIPYKTLAAGGTLTFDMGAEPVA